MTSTLGQHLEILRALRSKFGFFVLFMSFAPFCLLFYCLLSTRRFSEFDVRYDLVFVFMGVAFAAMSSLSYMSFLLAPKMGPLANWRASLVPNYASVYVRVYGILGFTLYVAFPVIGILVFAPSALRMWWILAVCLAASFCAIGMRRLYWTFCAIAIIACLAFFIWVANDGRILLEAIDAMNSLPFHIAGLASIAMIMLAIVNSAKLHFDVPEPQVNSWWQLAHDKLRCLTDVHGKPRPLAGAWSRIKYWRRTGRFGKWGAGILALSCYICVFTLIVDFPNSLVSILSIAPLCLCALLETNFRYIGANSLRPVRRAAFIEDFVFASLLDALWIFAWISLALAVAYAIGIGFYEWKVSGGLLACLFLSNLSLSLLFWGLSLLLAARFIRMSADSSFYKVFLLGFPLFLLDAGANICINALNPGILIHGMIWLLAPLGFLSAYCAYRHLLRIDLA